MKKSKKSEASLKTEKSGKKSSKVKKELNHGITGNGTDYTVYVMSTGQKAMAMLAGFVIGFGASYIYFGIMALGIIIGLILGVKAISVYRAMLFKKRWKELRIQFRDLLESLSNSYTVGMTASRAFKEAYEDMKVEHGDKSYIAEELKLICSAYENQGIEIKEMIKDFSQRSGLEDARSFAGVFDVATDLGGDIAKVIRESRDMIGDKIEVELEIQTMVTGQRNQLNILAIMPLVISVLLRCFNLGTISAMVIIVKLVALALFVFAYWLGTKIVDIKV